MTRALLILAGLFCLQQSALAAQTGLSGSLTSVGSDTASALVTRWASAFQAQHPGARIQVQAPGSASAPIALIEGAADLGSMSRPMNAGEQSRFAARYGYPPTEVVVARDAIVVFVHPDNPLTRITLADLDAIYSATRRCGRARAIRRWSDLEPAANAAIGATPLLATGRNASSGTHELFRESALCGGEYRPDVIAWPGNGAVVATVAANRGAIGYAGIGYVNGLVKPLALARSGTEVAIAPDLANVTQGRYPLSRALYVYVNRRPGRALAALPDAFLAYALSDAGQALVAREGFVPLGVEERRAQLAALQ
ncbi:MAG: PstS family phosphate ABC transporter substrate-binding protein [Lysobacterales bacterium]